MPCTVVTLFYFVLLKFTGFPVLLYGELAWSQTEDCTFLQKAEIFAQIFFLFPDSLGYFSSACIVCDQPMISVEVIHKQLKPVNCLLSATQAIHGLRNSFRFAANK